MNERNNQLLLLAIAHSLLGIIGSTGIISLWYIVYGMSEDRSYVISFSIIASVTLIYCISLFLSGVFIALRKNYRFSIAIAFIGCIFFSIPTYGIMAVFGLITIFVLTRDRTKRLYGLNE